jgi:hypothetical protein
MAFWFMGAGSINHPLRKAINLSNYNDIGHFVVAPQAFSVRLFSFSA